MEALWGQVFCVFGSLLYLQSQQQYQAFASVCYFSSCFHICTWLLWGNETSHVCLGTPHSILRQCSNSPGIYCLHYAPGNLPSGPDLLGENNWTKKKESWRILVNQFSLPWFQRSVYRWGNDSRLHWSVESMKWDCAVNGFFQTAKHHTQF